MSNFHKNFPFGKGIWIWELKNCLGGDINAIVAKMKQYDLQYAIVKSGDGPNTWEFQWTKELIDAFHNAGLKIYSWSYIYGLDPAREAAIASWSLNLGGDGHVFDAESEYEHLTNPTQAAETMLQALRAENPDSFLAHAPFPIIDFHQKFPYATFGKYCDAVMPQVYQGDFKMSSQDAVNWMYAQWSKWEASAPKESIKPIIPIAQTYDNYQLNPPYILKPQDVTDFINAVAGYKSVNFYEFAHVLRDECWAAMRDSKVTAPTNADLGIADNPTPAQAPSSTPPATPPTPAPVNQPVSTPPVEQPTSTPTVPTAAPASPTPSSDNLPQGTTVMQEKTLPVPSTIKVTSSPQSPGGVKLTVMPHKPHIEYVEEFFTWIATQFKKLFSKGGDSK